MKKNYIILLLIAAVAILHGCETKTSVTTYSEALVTSLTFASNDSFPGLSKASFTIYTSSDTGLIFNRDSLMYGTCLDSVRPKFTFNHSPNYVTIYCDTDTVYYTGSDTVNFNARPCYMYVMASDNEHDKWYEIYVNVHQVDPDLYHWECVNPGVFSADGAESKALYVDGVFYLFVNNGFRTQLYTSQDAAVWSAAETVVGLPSMCAIRHIIEDDGTLYYAQDQQLYTSTDGKTWTAEDYSGKGFTLVNMLYTFNDSIWAIAQRTSDQKLQLVNMKKGGELALVGDVLSDEFPVADFATLTFASASNRSRAMIVGGYDKAGNTVNSRWNVEWREGRGYSMTNFSIEQPNFAPLTGVSLLWYDHQFQMYGSMNADAEIGEYNILLSDDEGLNWYEPDSTKNFLPDSYLSRQKASVIKVDNDIYIIGGQSRTQTFSDVYHGWLNKTRFVDYE